MDKLRLARLVALTNCKVEQFNRRVVSNQWQQRVCIATSSALNVFIVGHVYFLSGVHWFDALVGVASVTAMLRYGQLDLKTWPVNTYSLPLKKPLVKLSLEQNLDSFALLVKESSSDEIIIGYLLADPVNKLLE